MGVWRQRESASVLFYAFTCRAFLESQTPIYYEKDYPIAGGNIVEREAKKINETTTDFNGKAQLIVADFNSEFELSYTGPHVRFKIPKKTEKIMINIEKRKIEYYKNNKIFKRKKIKLIGY